ncbi:DUF5320 domain-containing protein [Candidatus Nitrosocosmicus franklandus]|uniref:DUF5320 domain-containing protein n=1 Tax=Candidatus Nitrosocosmicus franklandianus TaxID=1798806 RepID=A0A484I6N5_9ARCH|nr:DUF5320 domain-containing protein [Candidatus Nitrosocosmicus franklandus]VFJ13389.1 conserved protein of unknown function [Candidatus Nitrosocosmicus franklandus]
MMSYSHCSSSYTLGSFLTREEKIQLLKEYHQDLKKELQGIEEKIKELEIS